MNTLYNCFTFYEICNISLVLLHNVFCAMENALIYVRVLTCALFLNSFDILNKIISIAECIIAECNL